MEQHANVSSYLPSPADLLLAVPRLLFKAGSLGEHIDNVFGKLRSGGSITERQGRHGRVPGVEKRRILLQLHHLEMGDCYLRDSKSSL
jgi:hypothetical protein